MNQAAAAGGTVNLSITATGDAPLTYQWLKDGRFILGATNSTLTMVNASATNSGVYCVAVANTYGLSITRPVTVTVGSPQLMAWGNDANGALGDGSIGPALSPEWETGNVVAAAAGGGYYLNGTTPWDYSFSLQLRSDGTVWGGGGNSFGQLGNGNTDSQATPVPVVGGSNVVAVSAGDTCSMFLKDDGTLWGMGQNNYGQLGDGTSTQRNSPVAVLNGSNVVAMAEGGEHTLFLKSDGTLWAMGYDGYGQLGDGGHPVPNVSHPVPVSMASNVVAVAAGQDHSLFLKTDGTLWSMGYNAFGQLGNGESGGNWAYTPVAVMGGTNVLAMAAGYNHSLFLKSDGTLWAMGDNTFGELGDGTETQRNTPVSVPGLLVATVKSGCSAQHTLAVGLSVAPAITSQPVSESVSGGSKVTFTVTAGGIGPLGYQWYYNGSAISGATTTNYTLAWVATTNMGNYMVVVSNTGGSVTSSVASLTVLAAPAITVPPTAQVVAEGGSLDLSVSAMGIAPTCQWLKDGRMILGATNSTLTLANVGVPDSGVYQVVVANAYGSTISLPVTVTVGTPQLMGWGKNTYNELGDGTTINRSHPESVLTNGVAAAAGEYHSLFVRGDGTLWAVGYNSYGQLGDGTTSPRSTPVFITNNVVAVAAGAQHSLFLKSDGTLWAMGVNDSGQLGDGTTTARRWPVFITNNVVAVAAGQLHSLFLKSDATLWAMGDNNYGELGLGTIDNNVHSVASNVASNVVAVAAGGQHSLYLKGNGTLWGMGENDWGEVGTGTTVNVSNAVSVASGVVAAAGGAFHSLYLKGDGTLWAMGYNGYGQLGVGTADNLPHSVPVNVATNVVAMAGGGQHSLYLKGNGTLWAMGYNVDGELGDGTTANSSSPVSVPGMSPANVISGNCAFQSFAVGVPLPPTITASVSGNTLSLTWPTIHRGWILQAQTNGLSTGLSTNWFDLPGTGDTNWAAIRINPSNPTVFHRLRQP